MDIARVKLFNSQDINIQFCKSFCDFQKSGGRKREAIYMWRQALDLAKPEDNIHDKVEKKLSKFHDK